jgi:methyl-accepting chemotaxis protein
VARQHPRTIGQKLILSFGGMALTVAVVDVTGWWAGRALNSGIDRLAGVSGQAMQLAGEIRFLVSDLQARERLVVIATAKGDKAVVSSELAQIDESSTRLKSAVETIARVSDDAQVHTKINGINAAIASWAGQWEKTKKLASDFDAMGASDSTEAGRKFGEEAQTLATEIQALQTKQFSADRERAASVYTNMAIVLAICLGVTALIAMAVLVLVRRINATLTSAAAELREGAEQVLGTSGQVAGSAQQLSRGVSEQAASLEETSASMEEMSSMTKRNADNSHEAARLMAEAETAVSGANETLGEMNTSMANIKESSRKVAKIIKTIDEIAFQTNILALNAAVEAARAGEAGMGFAVVADEVRNLAHRSAEAAKDTTVLIEESIARADRGAARVERVGASIGEMTKSVMSVKTLIDQVSEASRQQAHGFHQVAQALSQMEQSTQVNASTASQSASAGEQLRHQAERSLAAVERLEEFVGRTEAAAALERPAETEGHVEHASSKAATVVRMNPRFEHAADDDFDMGDGTFGR